MLVSAVVPVFRDAARAGQAAHALLAQEMPPGDLLEVILVDDGSADGTVDELRTLEPAVRVLALPQNQGRAGARNAGASVATGSIVLFMDCDCLPADRGLVAGHLAVLASGAAASCGRVAGVGPGFWNRFQADSSLRRERQHASHSEFSGASSNLAVRRGDLDAIGGFDTGYRRYGFEDRDLLIRLGQRGSIAWTTSTVRHQDHLSLTQVATKMAEAGQYSSRRFASRHPEPYRQLGYAAIDAHLHPACKPLGRLATPFAIGMANAFDRMRCDRWLPYVAARLVVKLTSALAYFGGTARSG